MWAGSRRDRRRRHRRAARRCAARAAYPNRRSRACPERAPGSARRAGGCSESSASTSRWLRAGAAAAALRPTRATPWTRLRRACVDACSAHRWSPRTSPGRFPASPQSTDEERRPPDKGGELARTIHERGSARRAGPVVGDSPTLERGLDRDAGALDHLVDLSRRHVQGRHEAKRVEPWRVEEEPHVLPARMLLELVARVGHGAARPRCPQVEGAEQAETALMREAEFGHETLELLAKVGAGGGDSLEKARGEQGLHHRAAHRGHERAAVEGAALLAVREDRYLVLRAEGGQGHAATQALAQRHDVGRLLVAPREVLVREELARAAHACLHLVGDEEALVPAGEGTELAQELHGGRQHTRLALYGLQHHRHGLLIDERLNGCDVVQGCLGEAVHLRSEHRVPARLAACRHGGEGAAVEAVVEGDDLERAAFGLPSPLAGELDGAFVRLRPGIGEEHTLEARVPGEERGQPQGRLIVEGGARRDELARLRGESARDGRRTVAEARDGPALDEVEIALARVVGEPGPLTLDEDDLRPLGDVHEAREVERVLRHGRDHDSQPP